MRSTDAPDVVQTSASDLIGEHGRENLILKGRKAAYYVLFSVMANVIVAPLLMTGIAWLTLPDLGE